jgi:hypothetical protein
MVLGSERIADCECPDCRVTLDVLNWVGLTAAVLLIVRSPLALLAMCSVLRLLGVSRTDVRKRALRFVDRWITGSAVFSASCAAKAPPSQRASVWSAAGRGSDGVIRALQWRSIQGDSVASSGWKGRRHRSDLRTGHQGGRPSRTAISGNLDREAEQR